MGTKSLKTINMKEVFDNLQTKVRGINNPAMGIIISLLKDYNNQLSIHFEKNPITRDFMDRVDRYILEESHSLPDDPFNLSSDVYVNKYAYVKSIDLIQNQEVVSVDIITDIVFNGPPENRTIEIVNQSKKTRNYVIDANTVFVDNPTLNNSQPALRDVFLQSMGSDSYFLVTTNSQGRLEKVVVPVAG